MSQKGTARTEQAGQNRQKKIPRQDCQEKAASTGLRGLDSQSRTERRGQPEKYSLNKTARAGQPGQQFLNLLEICSPM
jgi:hypothetical protein